MHSLIAPADRDQEKKSTTYAPKAVEEPLNTEKLKAAMALMSKDITFAQVDRYYADPAQMNQKIALVSFVPASGAKPDKDNIYGMMKVRGVYATEEEANERAEFLIRNVDSYHEIYHAYVGRPFPVTTSEGYATEIKKIDIRQKTTDVISDDILNKKRQERGEVEDIKDREKKLLDESKRAQAGEPMDIFEEYVTENVKRAQLAWTYHETLAKMKQMKESFNKATERIREIDEKEPEFVNRYRERYMEARRQSGIPDDNSSFIQYLGLDLSAEIEDAPNSALTRGQTV
jgi:hypothetical protein